MRTTLSYLVFALSCTWVLGCGGGSGGGANDGGPNHDGDLNLADGAVDPDCTIQSGTAVTDLRLEEVASGLSQPVFVTAPPGDDRVFVVEQPGRIRLIDNGGLVDTPFMDITAKVANGGGEEGLLGLAFHPDWATNGLFYVNYTRSGSPNETVIAEYQASSATADTADPSSERVILTVAQEFSNHNGGMIAFGQDGFLYIGMGDGGAGGDPNERGLDPDTLLGSMLRIDVDGRDSGQYSVPSSNPFADGQDGLPEVYAYGLRNPWRWSFDRSTGDAYIADVGQKRVEEVNVVTAANLGGANFGWDEYEGSECFNDTGMSDDWEVEGAGCTLSGTIDPAVEYYHTGLDPGTIPGGANVVGNSISGGYVYRGSCMPDLRGTYFYADFATSEIWSFVWNGSTATNNQDITASLNSGPAATASNPSSFGEDGYGELYVVSYNGRLFKIVHP